MVREADPTNYNVFRQAACVPYHRMRSDLILRGAKEGHPALAKGG